MTKSLYSFNLLLHKLIRLLRIFRQSCNPCTNPILRVYHLINPFLQSFDYLIDIFLYFFLVFLQSAIPVPTAWSIAGTYRGGIWSRTNHRLSCKGNVEWRELIYGSTTLQPWILLEHLIKFYGGPCIFSGHHPICREFYWELLINSEFPGGWGWQLNSVVECCAILGGCWGSSAVLCLFCPDYRSFVELCTGIVESFAQKPEFPSWEVFIHGLRIMGASM